MKNHGKLRVLASTSLFNKPIKFNKFGAKFFRFLTKHQKIPNYFSEGFGSIILLTVS